MLISIIPSLAIFVKWLCSWKLAHRGHDRTLIEPMGCTHSVVNILVSLHETMNTRPYLYFNICLELILFMKVFMEFYAMSLMCIYPNHLLLYKIKLKKFIYDANT